MCRVSYLYSVMMALLPLQAIDMSLLNRTWVRCNSGTMCGVFGHDSLATYRPRWGWCQAIVPRILTKGCIVNSSDNNTALTLTQGNVITDTGESINLGMVKTRAFQKTTQHSLVVLNYNQLLAKREGLEVDEAGNAVDKEALKKAKKIDGTIVTTIDEETGEETREVINLEKEFRTYRSEVSVALASVSAKAKQNNELRKVVIKLDNETNEVVDYQEHHGVIKVPKTRKSKTKELTESLADALTALTDQQGQIEALKLQLAAK